MADDTATDAASEASDAPPPLDLRVARVVVAREHPNADRLLLLDVDLGGGDTRQLVAGIRGHYELDQLGGKHIVVVANLQPARIRGEESQGMLLAAEDGDELGLLLAPGGEPGTRLTPGDGPADPVAFNDFLRHDIQADARGAVTLDGEPLEGVAVDRGVVGRLK